MAQRLIALDLGGVLVDVDRGALAAGTDRSSEAVEAAFFGAGRHDRFADGRLSANGYFEQVASALFVGAALAERAWAAMVEVRPGAAELMAAVEAEGMVAIWSNTDPVHWASLAPHLPACCAGATRALSFEIGAVKPDARFFEVALARGGARPSDTLFFDDRAENVAAARALGIEAYAARSVDDVKAHLRAVLGIAL